MIGASAPEEGREEANDEFYPPPKKKTFGKINKSHYVILARDLNSGAGNTPINKGNGKFGEPATNIIGFKLTPFTVCNNLRIMNILYNQREVCKCTLLLEVMLLIDYFIMNEETSLFLDMKVYRGCEIDTDHRTA